MTEAVQASTIDRSAAIFAPPIPCIVPLIVEDTSVVLRGATIRSAEIDEHRAIPLSRLAETTEFRLHDAMATFGHERSDRPPKGGGPNP